MKNFILAGREKFSLERMGLSIFKDKEGKEKYRIFVHTNTNGFQTILTPIYPDFSYIDYLKIKKLKKIPVFLKEDILYFNIYQRNAKIGIVFLFIAIGMFSLSIYELFSYN
jgi:hypothetical protein